MSIYLDTSDIKQIKYLSDYLPIAGVTTNPTIVAKSGEKISNLLPQIRDALGHEGLIFAQVIGNEAEQMVEEALRLNQYVDNLIVKIPVTMNGLKSIKVLKDNGIKTLGTAIYTPQQGILAALSGVDFVAPYVNRIDILTGNGIQTVETISNLLSIHAPGCQVLGASFKNTKQVLDCLNFHNSSVTISVDLARQLLQNATVDEAIVQFQADWIKSFGCLNL